MKVINTRWGIQGEELRALLLSAGIEEIHLPVLVIETLPFTLESSDTADALLIFTSANAVRALVASPSFSSVLLSRPAAAVGIETERALEGAGFCSIFRGEDAQWESLLEEIQQRAEKKFLFIRGVQVDEQFPLELQKRGELTQVIVYRSTPASYDRADISTKCVSPHAAFLFSSAAVRSFYALTKDILGLQIPLYCLGPKTAATATELGYESIYYPGQATSSAVVELYLSHR